MIKNQQHPIAVPQSKPGFLVYRCRMEGCGVVFRNQRSMDRPIYQEVEWTREQKDLREVIHHCNVEEGRFGIADLIGGLAS